MFYLFLLFRNQKKTDAVFGTFLLVEIRYMNMKSEDNAVVLVKYIGGCSRRKREIIKSTERETIQR